MSQVNKLSQVGYAVGLNIELRVVLLALDLVDCFIPFFSH